MTLATAGIVARVLGPDTMGHYGFALWIAMTMSAFAGVAVGGVMSRYVAEFVGSGELALAKTITRMCTWAQAGFSLVLVSIGLLYVWARIPEGQQMYNALVMISIFPGLMRVIPTMINATAEDFGANVIPSTANRWEFTWPWGPSRTPIFTVWNGPGGGQPESLSEIDFGERRINNIQNISCRKCFVSR